MIDFQSESLINTSYAEAVEVKEALKWKREDTSNKVEAEMLKSSPEKSHLFSYGFQTLLELLFES